MMGLPANAKGRTHAADSVVRAPVSLHPHVGRGLRLLSGLLRIDPAAEGGSRCNPGSDERSGGGPDSERGPRRGHSLGQRLLRPGVLRLLSRAPNRSPAAPNVLPAPDSIAPA